MRDGNKKWLNDESQWEALRNRLDSKPASKPARHKFKYKGLSSTKLPQKPVAGSREALDDKKRAAVSLNLVLPELKLPKLTKKQTRFGLAAAGIVVVGIVGLRAFNIFNKSDNKDVAGVLADNVTKPEFDTVLPDGKTDETESGKVGYDPQRKVASFADKIGLVNVTVSQQPLPDKFRANTDEEVKKLAEGFSANELINESDPKAYLGTDVKGPQTVIFHKNGLLVFILSEQGIPKSDWAAYIKTLQ